MAIHLDLTSPSGSSSLPEGRASNSIAFCLALLPMRLAVRRSVTRSPVVSYTAVSPLPAGSSSLPEGRASNSIAFCLALLPMRLAVRRSVTRSPVVSYTAVSPLPANSRRSVLCCAISQVTLGRRYLPSCSLEPGSSSIAYAIAAIKRSRNDCSKGQDRAGAQKRPTITKVATVGSIYSDFWRKWCVFSRIEERRGVSCTVPCRLGYNMKHSRAAVAVRFRI